ncbi:MAG: PilZ domain-containing protein [Chloracidobacterium sp.]|nr:PilZ domain-containing protein [Chloracidobacterium sp.]
MSRSPLSRRTDSHQTKETAVTNNISAKGLSAICKLSAEIGDRVKLACKEYDFYAIAIVRNCKPADNGNSIHLEFLENGFPMEKLYAERRGGSYAST